MVRQRIDLDGVIEQAIALVDDAGLDELALSKVADQLGVQASALYNHVDGLEGLRQAVADRAADNLAEALRDAAVGRSGGHAVRAVALAYRSFATAHHGQYTSTLVRPANGSEGSARQRTTTVDVLARILETYGLEGDRAVHMARIVRSAIHGFVTLEASESFTSQQDNDESFDELLDFVVAGLERVEEQGTDR